MKWNKFKEIASSIFYRLFAYILITITLLAIMYSSKFRK